MKNYNLKVLGLITFITIILVFIITEFNNYFGSRVDWLAQHVMFPDYFRTLFYQTKELLPNFAFHIGAGQNIYYLSYYGFLSPYTILSYLFPFIKMIDYMVIISIIIIITSTFLFYKWLINNNIKNNVSLVTTILFLLSNALILHMHKHIMFVNYMPFLLLGLIGIDHYFNKHKKGLYIISVFLMIMTSYYYSVGGILCLIIYGIYKYLKLNPKSTYKQFLYTGFKFMIPIIIGILMASILLIPTTLVIMQGRVVIDNPVDWLSLLLPKINIQALLYSGYGIGFTAIALISLIGSYFIPKKEIRFLVITLSIILIIPLFCYLLNGMLYIRAKSLIPFMPLVGLIIAIFLTAINNNEINDKKLIMGIFFFLALTLLIDDNIEYYHYLDLIITTIIIIWTFRKQKTIFLYIFVIIIAIFSNLLLNKNELLITKEIYNASFNNDKMLLIKDIIKNDQSFYRMNDFAGNTSHTVNKIYDACYYQTSIYSSTFNKNYHYFFFDVIMNAVPYRNNLLTTQSNNIMFQTLMGVKYVISDNESPVGYKLINSQNKLKVYKNDNVFPLGYASSLLLSEETLNQLSFPYKSEALINHIIINKKINNEFNSKINELELNFNYEIGDNISIEKENGVYIIDVEKPDTINLELFNDYSDQIIFIEFTLKEAPDCRDGDISITINDVTNKLTCKQWLYFNNNYQFQYTLSNNNKLDHLNIKFSKGYFVISDISYIV